MHDRSIEVRVEEVQTRCRAPVAQQTRLDVLRLEIFAQQRIVPQVDLSDGKVVGGPPPFIQSMKLVVGQRAGRHLAAYCRLIHNHGVLRSRRGESRSRSLSTPPRALAERLSSMQAYPHRRPLFGVGSITASLRTPQPAEVGPFGSISRGHRPWRYSIARRLKPTEWGCSH